jgi:hypothetical protein
LLAALYLLISPGCERSNPALEQPALEGSLERVDNEFIAGWAWDRNLPWPPTKVDLYDGDTFLATVPADRYQQGLLDAGIGSGNHAFAFATPARLKDGRAHTVRVKFSGTDKELDGSPKELPSPKASVPAAAPEQGELPPRLSDQEYQQLIQEVRQVVNRTLPADATVIVASHGDDELLKLGGRKAWHFPQDKDGAYNGNLIADSDGAIKLVEALQARGGQFLLFPRSAFWWLDDKQGYKGFKQRLEDRYRRFYGDKHCVIYKLSRP